MCLPRSKLKTKSALNNKKENDMTSQQPKKMNKQSISRWIALITEKIELLVHGIFELFNNVLRLLLFLFRYLVILFANPTTPCIVAILAFGASTAIATLQWSLIGQWLGTLLGFNNIYGVASGIAGVILGLGINIYQLAPQLWKLRRDIAKVYAEQNINTDLQEEETVKSKSQNWLSFDHKALKTARLISYSLETVLVLGYVAFTGFSFYAIIQAAVSLLLPEKCLEWTQSTISLLGSVSDKMAEDQTKKQHNF
jgi:hypothetical protein